MKGCRPLTDEEIGRIKESFAGEYALRDRALFVFGLKTGFRISEILTIRVGAVCHQGRILDAVAVKRRHMKKKTEGRVVPLHQEVREVFEDLIASMKENGEVSGETFLFQSRKGCNQAISRTQAWRILKNAFNRNDINGQLGTHSMRKTFADRMYEKLNRDLIKTQKALSHRNINSTVSYLSFKEEEISEAILSL